MCGGRHTSVKNLSTWEAKGGGSGVQDHSGLWETVSQNNNNNNNNKLRTLLLVDLKIVHSRSYSFLFCCIFLECLILYVAHTV